MKKQFTVVSVAAAMALAAGITAFAAPGMGAGFGDRNSFNSSIGNASMGNVYMMDNGRGDADRGSAGRANEAAGRNAAAGRDLMDMGRSTDAGKAADDQKDAGNAKAAGDKRDIGNTKIFDDDKNSDDVKAVDNEKDSNQDKIPDGDMKNLESGMLDRGQGGIGQMQAPPMDAQNNGQGGFGQMQAPPMDAQNSGQGGFGEMQAPPMDGQNGGQGGFGQMQAPPVDALNGDQGGFGEMHAPGRKTDEEALSEGNEKPELPEGISAPEDISAGKESVGNADEESDSSDAQKELPPMAEGKGGFGAGMMNGGQGGYGHMQMSPMDGRNGKQNGSQNGGQSGFGEMQLPPMDGQNGGQNGMGQMQAPPVDAQNGGQSGIGQMQAPERKTDEEALSEKNEKPELPEGVSTPEDILAQEEKDEDDNTTGDFIQGPIIPGFGQAVAGEGMGKSDMEKGFGPGFRLGRKADQEAMKEGNARLELPAGVTESAAEEDASEEGDAAAK